MQLNPASCHQADAGGTASATFMATTAVMMDIAGASLVLVVTDQSLREEFPRTL